MILIIITAFCSGFMLCTLTLIPAGIRACANDAISDSPSSAWIEALQEARARKLEHQP